MDAINGLVVQVTQYLQAAVQFVVAEAPALIQELLAYERVRLTVSVVFWPAISVAITFLVANLLKGALADDIPDGKRLRYRIQRFAEEQDGFALGLGSVLAAGVVIIVTALLLCVIPKLLQVWIAPKLYLLAYLKKILH